MEVSVGPVQTFIVSARRTRDFWFGSKFISELGKTMARAITENDKKTQLIFPSADSNELKCWSDFSGTNVIMAQIEEDPKIIGSKVRQAVLDFAKQEIDNILKRLTDQKIVFNGNAEIAVQQVLDGIELYWVAVPLEITDDSSTYATARKNLQKAMAMRKTARLFKQPTWASNTDKSSIDGQREAVLVASSDLPLDEIEVKPNECLSGIDLLKRFGKSSNTRDNEGAFPSTSHMAAMPFLKHLENIGDAISPKIKQSWNNYIQSLPKQMLMFEKVKTDDFTLKRFVGNIDGALLYPERALDYAKPDQTKMQKIQRAYMAFFNDLRQDFPYIHPPLPYYAFFKADGDSMGKCIDEINDIIIHQNFSKMLSEFAKEAKNTIENNAGKAIYTGGDDVTAILPLHTAIKCAIEIHSAFDNKIAEFKKHNAEGIHWKQDPTISAGLVVAHHLEPLTNVFKLAEEAEKAAKQYNNQSKNALAITISKRSGSDTTFVENWNTVSHRFIRLIELAQNNAIPDGLGYELYKIAKEFGFHSKYHAEMESAEIYRILKRKKMAEEHLKTLLKLIQIEPGSAYNGSSAAQIAKELIAAQLIAQSIYSDNLNRNVAAGKEYK